jgi:hypothetical protein
MTATTAAPARNWEDALAGWRLHAVVAACAMVVYVGALWNGFVLDDRAIILQNPHMARPSGIGRVFLEPYWPPELGGPLYRPLAVTTYVLDALVGGAPWFHFVNLLWHAAASVAVAALARRWAGTATALAAGLVFAAHPVHVEAVANVVGRAELMVGLFSLLAVYAGVVRQSVGWSTAAFVLGLLCKENAVTIPVIIAWAWLVGFGRPPRRTVALFVAAWALVGAAYAVVRWAALHRYTFGILGVAPVFWEAGPIAVRLTAVATLADVARLLVFPLTLRADYSPAERSLVTSPLDGRFLLGLLCLAIWGLLLGRAWRRGRRVEAFGLGWIGIAYLPVANLLFPVGVLVAERTLYSPSIGFALALGAWLGRLARRPAALVGALLVLAGGARSGVRVPVWHDDLSVVLSILEDSPASYRGPLYTANILQAKRQPAQALEYYLIAFHIFGRDSRLLIGAADAARALGRPALADSLIGEARARCGRCEASLRNQVAVALARGDRAVATWLWAQLRTTEGPRK